MQSLHIEVDAPKPMPPEAFDRLGIQALQLLSDLIPGVQVFVRYVQPQEDPKLPGVTSVTSTTVNVPGLLWSCFQRCPGRQEWWRDVKLVMTPASSEFLALGSDDLLRDEHGNKNPTPRRNLPRELNYAAAICQDVSGAWTESLDPHAPLDATLALTSELPTWIIAHIAADLYYSFLTYSSGRGKHDLLALTIAVTIDYLERLAASRVEHELLSHGVVIARPHRSLKPIGLGSYPASFRDLKRTPLLSNGVDSLLWISPEGEPIALVTREFLKGFGGRKRKGEPVANWSFAAVASDRLRGLSVVLREDGSVMLFSLGQPLFLRRQGRWRGLLWGAVREAMHRKFDVVGELVFDAALKLSASGHGGVLAIVKSLPDGLHEKDKTLVARRAYLDREGAAASKAQEAAPVPYPEWLFHCLIPGQDIRALGVDALAMLAAVDGATIVTEKGDMAAYGAVIPSRPAGSEGARSAAARQLSEKGFVVKVSADGPITLFDNGEELIEV